VLIWADAALRTAPKAEAPHVKLGELGPEGRLARPWAVSAAEVSAWHGEFAEVVTSDAQRHARAREGDGRFCYTSAPLGSTALALSVFVHRDDLAKVLTKPIAAEQSDGTAVGLRPGAAVVPLPDNAGLALAPQELPVRVSTGGLVFELGVDAAALSLEYTPAAAPPYTACAGDVDCPSADVCVDERCRPAPAQVLEATAPLTLGGRTVARAPAMGNSATATVRAPDVAPVFVLNQTKDEKGALASMESRCAAFRLRVPEGTISKRPRREDVEDISGLSGARGLGKAFSVPKGARVFWEDGRPAGALLDDRAYFEAGREAGELRCFTEAIAANPHAERPATRPALTLCYRAADVRDPGGRVPTTPQ
jgi:hypothetical protein